MTDPQDAPQAVDASEMPPEAYKGLTVGNMFGLLVGSGAPPNVVVSNQPFADADQFPLTKYLNGPQFDDELSQATQRTVHSSMTGFQPPASSISDANPAVLWITPSGLDADVIQTVVANHSPYAEYGESAEDSAFSGIMERLDANETLTLSDDELQTVVRGLAKWYRISNAAATPEPSFTPSATN